MKRSPELKMFILKLRNLYVRVVGELITELPPRKGGQRPVFFLLLVINSN